MNKNFLFCLSNKKNQIFHFLSLSRELIGIGLIIALTKRKRGEGKRANGGCGCAVLCYRFLIIYSSDWGRCHHDPILNHYPSLLFSSLLLFSPPILYMLPCPSHAMYPFSSPCTLHVMRIISNRISFEINQSLSRINCHPSLATWQCQHRWLNIIRAPDFFSREFLTRGIKRSLLPRYEQFNHVRGSYQGV